MNEAVPETYILPVPGSDQTQELARSVVLEKIAKGEIKQTDWVWSGPDQDWKTVAETPSLQPAQKKSFFGGPLGPVGAKQKIEPIVAPSRALPPAPKKKKVKPRKTKSDDDEDEPSRFGMFLCVMIILLFAVVAANYQLIDRPLDGSLAQTQFVLVPAHAHLGAFVQRDQLVIHILPTSELNPDNFADFLFALASSTPPPPWGATDFTVIELTPGWRGEFAFTGDDWRHLAKMTSNTATDRKDFILEHIDDAGGQKLVSATDQASRDQAWQNLTGKFHAEGNPADGGWVTSIIGMISSVVSQVSSYIPHGGGSTTTPDSSSPAAGPVVSAPGLFTYHVPDGWTVKTDSSLRYPEAMLMDGTTLKANLIINEEPDAGSIDQAIDIIKKSLSAMFPDAKISDQSSIQTASGLKGVRFLHSETSSGESLTGVAYIIDGGDNRKIILQGFCKAGTESIYNPLFDGAVQTLTSP